MAVWLEKGRSRTIAVKLRIPNDVLRRLQIVAKINNRSANAEIVRRLERGLLGDEIKDSIHPEYHAVIDEIVGS